MGTIKHMRINMVGVCLSVMQERGLTAEGGWWDGIQSTSGGLAFDRVQEYFFYWARRGSGSVYLGTGVYMVVVGR